MDRLNRSIVVPMPEWKGSGYAQVAALLLPHVAPVYIGCRRDALGKPVIRGNGFWVASGHDNGLRVIREADPDEGDLGGVWIGLRPENEGLVVAAESHRVEFLLLTTDLLPAVTNKLVGWSDQKKLPRELLSLGRFIHDSGQEWAGWSTRERLSRAVPILK